MAYSAKILTDSISPDGARLTTIEVTFPRIVLAEFNTHRVFSRNSASSRAIPVKTMLERVENDPFVPIWWGKNQKGMQAAEELSDVNDQTEVYGDKPDKCYSYSSPRSRAQEQWYIARRHAVDVVKRMQEPDIDLHKQIANRLLEPFMWHTVIVSATEWDNFWGLRKHKDAQPEIRKAAVLMHDVYLASTPSPVNYGDWHTPLVGKDEAFNLAVQGFDVRKVSAGRCARVSYLTHDGKRDPQADVDLCERLVGSGHMSPMEHVARPLDIGDVESLLGQPGVSGIDRLDVRPGETFCGNFRGWRQLRKTMPHEANFLSRPTT